MQLVGAFFQFVQIHFRCVFERKHRNIAVGEGREQEHTVVKHDAQFFHKMVETLVALPPIGDKNALLG